MGRRGLLFGFCLLAFSATMWGQLPVVPGTDEPERPQHTHRHDRRVNFGIKGGFTSSLFLVSDLVLNGTVIDEVQNNYKIGYFGSFFMRINFKRHFLQPELSYTINRCNITFEKPLPEDAPENTLYLGQAEQGHFREFRPTGYRRRALSAERQLHGRRCRNDFTRILRLPLRHRTAQHFKAHQLQAGLR